MPIAYDATLRHYRGGHAGLVAEALEQPLLLPKDMEAYRNFNHPELLLSLKRALTMVSVCTHCSSFIYLHFLAFYSKSEIPFFFSFFFSFFFFFFISRSQQVFMAEKWVKNARGETRIALDARAKVETELGALKEKHTKMAEQLKEAVRARDSAKAGLKTMVRQFKEMRKELHYSEINLATKKQMVTELRKARETAQLFKEAAEAEKQATYALGVQETRSRLTKEFFAVARDYYDIS